MPNLKIKYLLLCDYFILSQEGKLSIIGEFDTLFTTLDQATLSKAYLITKLVGQPGQEANFLIRVVDTHGKMVFETELNARASEQGLIPVSFELSNVVFDQFGSYKFQIIEDKKVIGETELEVKKMKGQTPAQA